MPSSSTIKDWIKEMQSSPYRSDLFNRGGQLILHREKDKDDLIRFPFYNIFIANRHMFDPIKLITDFPREYFYQPKKLSMRLYGDTSLWRILLILNKCHSEVDFFGNRLWYLDPDQVMTYMSRMFIDEDVNTTVYDT